MRGRDESFCFRNARTRNKHSRHTRLSTQNARAAKWSPDLYPQQIPHRHRKQIPLSRPHARVLATLPPPCRIQRTVVSCVLCADLSLRESIAHPPPLVRPRRRFVCRPRRQLSPNDGLFFPHRPSKKPRLLACFIPPLRLCVCVCAFSMSRHSLPAGRTWSPASPHGVIKSKVIVCALKL